MMYFAKIDEPAQLGSDLRGTSTSMFANSTNETQTQNERDWLRGRIAQIGDMQFFVNAIVGAVLFTLLFLTGNTMMQSVRERIPELAVLKTYGFSERRDRGARVRRGAAALRRGRRIGVAIAAALSPVIYRHRRGRDVASRSASSAPASRSPRPSRS